MIVYRGYGLAIVGIILGSTLIANLLVNAFAGHSYWDTHGWPLAAALAFDFLLLLTIDRIMSDRQGLAGLAISILLFHWAPGPG